LYFTIINILRYQLKFISLTSFG